MVRSPITCIRGGLVGWWPVRHYQDMTSAVDQIVLPQNGAPVPTAGPSIRAPGIKFNTTSDFYVATKNYPSLTINGNVTICFWFLTTAVPGGNSCFLADCDPSGNFASYAVTINNVGGGGVVSVNFWSTATGASFSSATGGLNDSKWHHVAVSRNGTSGRIYLNGVLDNTGTVSSGAGTSNDKFAINEFGGFPGYHFVWSGADIRIYNRALSDAEVAAIYREVFLPEGIFWPGIDALGWIPRSAVAPSARFRKTLSSIGGRVGTRQSQGWGS